MPLSSDHAKETKNSTTNKDKKNYFEVRIPKFTFENTRMNAFLVVSLIIFAFLLGMLTNKVLFLQEQNKVLLANPTPAEGDVAAAPTPLPVIKDLKVGKLPLLGNKDAKVTVVEFSDFQCPFCEKFFTETEKQLYDTYIKTNKIAFAYRHYPLSSIHPLAQKAAEAAECANEQSKFWDYHNVLFQNQTSWSPQTAEDVAQTFTNYASDLGLDTVQFASCLESEKYKQQVATDTADGDKAQVDGTPTFFINGRRVVGAVPFADLQKVIDEELKK